ncbi:hypothetical protein PSTT_03515 [Puccinia striiformis]|uniref:Uncharacterized protein n=1 Tax=Puccinia striiformis TaxID=27350 RepID=A0A2S4VWF7_9BASI|nr:hypothetical protein PSTT_03515 [Puccinia striiformis]
MSNAISSPSASLPPKPLYPYPTLIDCPSRTRSRCFYRPCPYHPKVHLANLYIFGFTKTRDVNSNNTNNSTPSAGSPEELSIAYVSLEPAISVLVTLT